jgi:hypothetical protein
VRKIGLILLSIILPLAIASCFALSSTSLFNEFTDAPSKVDLKDLTIWYIGNTNGMFDKVSDRMQQLGVKQIKNLEIGKFFSNNTSESMSFDQESLVILDSYWISERVNDLEMHRFLREASFQKAKLAAVGELTSKFFEALDKAGVNGLGRDENGNVRNPAYYNPPLVGFRLKQASAPDGHSYLYPSIFTSNSADIDVMIQSLINWLGG